MVKCADPCILVLVKTAMVASLNLFIKSENDDSMVDTKNLIAELLAKFAHGDALTEKEMAFLEQIRNISEEHRAAVDLIREQPWLDTSFETSVQVPSADIWAAVADHISQGKEADRQPEEKTTPTAVPLHRVGWAVAVAAAAVLGGVAMVTIWQARRTDKKNTLAAATVIKPAYQPKPLPAAGRRIVLTRADGSQAILDTLPKGEAVTLENNHSIRKIDDQQYREEGAFGVSSGQPFLSVGQQRLAIDLYLTDSSRIQIKPGAAFGLPGRDLQVAARVEGLVWFSVQKNCQKQMMVKTTDGVLTRVLGTCFAVDARKGRKTSVTLAYGAVRVIKGRDSARLRPNQQAVLINGRLKVDSLHDKTGLLAWSGVSHVFRFDSTSLETAVTEIGNFYGLTVENPDHIKGIPISGPYPATKNPEELIQQIQKVESGAAYLRISAGKIIISGM